MKIIFLPFFLASFLFSGSHVKSIPAECINTTDSVSFMFGNFTDDYGIHYSINDTLWVQLPVIKYHILKWNKKENYFIARNDDNNPTEGGLYSRIDYMQFHKMAPWLWGFCYTAYKAKNDADAEASAPADTKNPRKGCNGYPFSRMMKTE
jgi:hypothetical protein